MTEDKGTYRQILRATSIYGGVQLFTILVSIIRGKTIALWLGPAGMGLFAIFSSVSTLIGTISNLGLSTSAVKSISSSYANGDSFAFSKSVKIFRILVVFTGLLGFIITICISSWLSKLNFNDYSYTLSFVILAGTIFLSQLFQGKVVVLQGMQKIKLLANTTLWSAVIGLIINLPLFYYFREKAIVPSILILSIISLLIANFFSRKIVIDKVTISFKTVKEEGSSILKMGFLISLTGILTQLTFYFIRLFILKKGTVEDVGFYNAGFSLISTYFGLVLTAMGTDYYPRLSKVADDNEKSFKEMNYQAEIAILIIAPLLCFFLVFINLGVIILYSKDFLQAVPMLKWGVIGVFFQACSWSIAFIFLAKGDSKQYFWNEIITLAYFIGINLVCYLYFGLEGLGIAFLLQYVVYMLHMYFVVKIKYKFKVFRSTALLLTIQFLMIVMCFIFTKFFNNTFAYIGGTIFAIASLLYSFKELEKRMNLKSLIIGRFKGSKM